MSKENKLKYFDNTPQSSEDWMGIMERIVEASQWFKNDTNDIINNLEQRLHNYQIELISKIIDDLKVKLWNNSENKLEIQEFVDKFISYKLYLEKKIDYYNFCRKNYNMKSIEQENQFFWNREECHKFYDDYQKLEDELVDMVLFYENKFNT